MEEVWKPCVGYERYEVSNLGRVRNGKGLLLKIKKQNNNQYLMVQLYVGRTNYKKRYKVMLVHRLVAMAFIPNPDNLPEVNHKDENPLNNCASNLEWCSHHANMLYSWNIHKTNYTVEHMKRKVNKVNPDTGEILATYATQLEAAQANGCTAGGLNTCMRHGWKMYGYYYQYAD